MSKLNLNKDLRYLLACSYGPDSMALFYMLLEGGYNFECAIVNYHIRQESTDEVNGLIEYANKYGVKVHVHECDKDTKKTEAKCREIRYAFFRSLFDQNGYDALLVAHNQDDRIETYLIQKSRQNCPKIFGIAGKTMIKGMDVIRPLLDCSKRELEELCLKNHVPYAIDKTNFDTSILRNKIRHEVVAKMSAQDRQQILAEIDKKNLELEEMISSIDFKRIHEVDYLLSLDEQKLGYTLNFMVKNIRDDYFLSKLNVGEIHKVLVSKKPNVMLKVKNGVFLVKEYGLIDLIKPEKEDVSYRYVLDCPSKLDTDYFYLDFEGETSNRNISISDYPITIRNIEPSDHIFINGYKVLARRLLIDWKMPLRLRKRWPIILDKNGEPIYIPRYRKEFVPDSETNFFVK